MLGTVARTELAEEPTLLATLPTLPWPPLLPHSFNSPAARELLNGEIFTTLQDRSSSKDGPSTTTACVRTPCLATSCPLRRLWHGRPRQLLRALASHSVVNQHGGTCSSALVATGTLQCAASSFWYSARNPHVVVMPSTPAAALNASSMSGPAASVKVERPSGVVSLLRVFAQSHGRGAPEALS